jgi:hypothetical protein
MTSSTTTPGGSHASCALVASLLGSCSWNAERRVEAPPRRRHRSRSVQASSQRQRQPRLDGALWDSRKPSAARRGAGSFQVEDRSLAPLVGPLLLSRDRRAGVLGCYGARCRQRDDDVYLETNQLGRELWQAVEPVPCKSGSDDDVLRDLRHIRADRQPADVLAKSIFSDSSLRPPPSPASTSCPSRGTSSWRCEMLLGLPR